MSFVNNFFTRLLLTVVPYCQMLCTIATIMAIRNAVIIAIMLISLLL